MIKFSIIIPVYNEEKNLPKLVDEIYTHLNIYKNQFDLTFVDDCSNDKTAEILKNLKKNFLFNISTNKTNRGQSFCIYNAITKSKYETIITIDGDGQNNPKDIINLLNVYSNNEDVKLVSGIRKNRKDSWLKKVSSKIANRIRMLILGDDCEDTGCSLKIFNKDIFLSYGYFNGIHRYIPTLFNARKAKIKYVNVDHRYREFGRSKYGTIDRLLRGIRDIIKVAILIKKK